MWVKSINNRGDDDGVGGEYNSCQKHESVSLHDLRIDRHLFDVSFIISLKSNMYTSLKTHNTANNGIIPHRNNTSALQPNVFLLRSIGSVHKHQTVNFPQRKQLSRSTANSSVSMCSFVQVLPFRRNQSTKLDGLTRHKTVNLIPP
jgi:hypothetical protein